MYASLSHLEFFSGSLPIEVAEFTSKEQYERFLCGSYSGAVSPAHSSLEHKLEGEVLRIDCFLRPIDIANLLKTDLRFVAELRSRWRFNFIVK